MLAVSGGETNSPLLCRLLVVHIQAACLLFATCDNHMCTGHLEELHHANAVQLYDWLMPRMR